MPRSPQDESLITQFLATVADYGAREIGRMVPGVTHDDVSRWRNGKWKRLSGEKRRAIIAFLRTQVAPEHQDGSEALFGQHEQRAAEWAREAGLEVQPPTSQIVRTADFQVIFPDAPDRPVFVEVAPADLLGSRRRQIPPDQPYVVVSSEANREAFLRAIQDARSEYEHGPALEWLRDFEGMVRMVGGKGDRDDDERRRLQRDIVNSYIDAMKARGAEVPAALYELLGRLDRGEL